MKERRNTALESEFIGDTGSTAIVVLGGELPDRRMVDRLPPATSVICADSGLDHALDLGLSPTVVIGDLDSVDGTRLAQARERGCIVHEHPADKDLTDTELALEFVVDQGFQHVTIAWGGGDRIDHVLGVIAALSHPRLGSLESLEAWLGSDHIDVVHAGRTLLARREIGSTISLIPIGARGSVVTTSGLRWNLDRSLLSADAARGLSNIVVEPTCSVHAHRGVTAVVTPGHLGAVAIENRTEPRTNEEGARQ